MGRSGASRFGIRQDGFQALLKHFHAYHIHRRAREYSLCHRDDVIRVLAWRKLCVYGNRDRQHHLDNVFQLAHLTGQVHVKLNSLRVSEDEIER